MLAREDPAGFEARLAASLARVVPGFVALRSVRRQSGGASQETYRVDLETRDGPRALAVRRAPGGVDPGEAAPGPGLAVEAELLRVARAHGVPVPEVLHVFAPEEGLGPGFAMEWLEGETLGSRIVRAPELEDIRPRLAFECGRILARIHAIDPVATGLAGRLRTVPTEAFVREVWERYRAIGTARPMIDYTARWLLDHLPPERPPRLVHNDFRNGNLMVTPGGIVAVLDWELAHLGDPVRDLGWICTRSWRFGRHDLPVGGFGRLEDLLAGYEDESGVHVDPEHVRFWEVFGSFWWAAMSLLGAVVWRHGPDRSVERPAIARRSSECEMDCANGIVPGPVELAPERPPESSVDAPRVDELLASVTGFLRGDARRDLQGRSAFLARVAANALDIVARELTRGPAHRAREHERLRALLGEDAPLERLRERLCAGLRDGSIPLDLPGLADHLRHTAASQLAIDQPGYPALAEALGRGGAEGAGSLRDSRGAGPPGTEGPG